MVDWNLQFAEMRRKEQEFKDRFNASQQGHNKITYDFYQGMLAEATRQLTQIEQSSGRFSPEYRNMENMANGWNREAQKAWDHLRTFR